MARSSAVATCNAPACMAIRVTWWETTSCISRASLVRSAARTVSAYSAFSRSRLLARSVMRAESSLRAVISMPMATGMPATMTPQITSRACSRQVMDAKSLSGQMMK